jgi:hypothetical protein
MDWYTTLQAAIDFYFSNLEVLTLLEYMAIAFLMTKKILPKGLVGKKKGGLF